ncbi:kinase-like protein [Rhizophagus irregularis]|uniref:Kinase-like protein n=1 Tax=Rhizophagus irregularis TaxID=588596 RepID=A0A2I1FYS0_9GLOM|nr:kinase-like protein [Rhizophagus irregularis]
MGSKKKDDFAENLGDSALMVVPFAKFLPLINEIGNFFNEIIELVEDAEHNKRICEILKNRVRVAELSVQDLREKRKDRQDFFNKLNYIRLQELSIIITRIKNFISEISQMKTLIKYLKEKNIEKIFKELCEEFDVYINLLSFSINVNIADELEQLKSDQDDLFKYLQEMVAGINDNDCFADLSKKFFSTIVKVNAMNNAMGRFMKGTSENQTKIDNIFPVHPLKFSDYERDDNEKPRRYGCVTKWYKTTTNKGAEFAFKKISDREEERIVQNQVTILKELHDWQNIIKFYGLTCEGNNWYLVTEWVECRNLREFYRNKNDFDLKLKLRISLDIARGLNFLRTVEILHRDIRAENILITFNETAKLTNFRNFNSIAALSPSHKLDRFRYCAPELMKRSPYVKYDNRCEVFSFGILLWEIAEERIPHQGNDELIDIFDKVSNKMYREPFSENGQMPEEFKRLEIEAVHHDPDFRPKITKMFEVLNNCFKKYSQVTSNSSGPNLSGNSRNNSMQKSRPKRADNIDACVLPDLESFGYMTLTDATKQERMYDNYGRLVGNAKSAYECFEAYANFDNTGGTANHSQIKAKYYKAIYISKGYVRSPPNKDKIVAELFKEVADDEANDFPAAKVRYGDCLYHGKGVDQNFSEALKYFEKAAEDDFKVAMYNAGSMYYYGFGCTKDIEKAKYYMKLATYNNYEAAIKFCKEHNL